MSEDSHGDWMGASHSKDPKELVMFLYHPDPSTRMAAAENNHLPLEAVFLFLDDTHYAVRNAAERRLKHILSLSLDNFKEHIDQQFEYTHHWLYGNRAVKMAMEQIKKEVERRQNEKRNESKRINSSTI